MADRELDTLPARSVAVVRAFREPLNRALLIGGGVAVLVVIALVALGAYERLTWAITPFIVAAVGGLIGVLVALLVLPRNVRRAFEAYSWTGHAEVERFKERTGSAVPRKAAAMEAWLAANPATPAMSLPRVELLAFLGRHADARTELDQIPAGRPDIAFEIASLRQYIDWLESATPDLSPLTAAAAELPVGSDDVRTRAVTIAIAQARILIMSGHADWTAPLEAVRADLGLAPWRATIIDTWRPFGVMYWFVGLIAAFLVPLLRSTL
jgi:hypothetical protein